MTNVNLSAGKVAVDTLKEAQNVGKQLSGVVTDQQADMERNVQEQHRKRMQEKAQMELQASSEDFRAYDKYEAEKKYSCCYRNRKRSGGQSFMRRRGADKY